MPNPSLEQLHIQQFIKLFLTTDIIAIPQNPPEPDFLIRSNNKLIGIEHTQLIRLPDANGINIKAHNSIEDKIMLKAEELYNEKHNNCLRVNVSFRCDYGLASQTPTQLFNNYINYLSEFVANFISEKLPFIESSSHLSTFKFGAFDWHTIILPKYWTAE